MSEDRVREGSDDRDEVDFVDEDEYPHDLVIQLKRKLTVHGKLYLSLPKVEEGWTRKMRFTIVTLCPECGGANHVEHVDLDKREKRECAVCRNSQVFATKTDVFHVYAPIGTRHGSKILIPDEGSFGPQGIRGDIVVTFFDEPHEHFLRICDDIIVFFQIDREEFANGVVRLLTLAVPSPRGIVLKTEEGQPVHNNEVQYVSGLGLPSFIKENNKRTRGRLIIVFIVKDQRSMFPVKLKDIVMSSGHVGDNGHREEKAPNGTFPTAGIDETLHANSTVPETNGLKLNWAHREENPRKRRKGGKASTSSDFTSPDSDSPNKPDDPPYIKIGEHEARCSRILHHPTERLTASQITNIGPLDPKRLSFIDRLIYSRTIPLPYKTRISDTIPMAKLRLLWEKISDQVWWQRAKWVQSLPKDPDTLREEHFPRRRSLRRDSEICFDDTPLFDLREVKLDESAEFLKTQGTTQNSLNYDYLQFTPQKLTSDEMYQQLYRIKRYLQREDQ